MNPIEAVKADLSQAVGRMIQLVDGTPEDRLSWKPSPSSRSIIEVVAHTAHALRNIVSQMRGTPYDVPNSAAANALFLAHDATFTTKEDAVQYLLEGHDIYVAFLESLDLSDLDRSAPLPFGLGEAALRDYIPAGYHHTLGHIGQIEYIQTMYGDLDWRFGF